MSFIGKISDEIILAINVNSILLLFYYSKDGVLVLEAPVQSPDYTSVVPHETGYADKYKSQANQGLVIRSKSSFLNWLYFKYCLITSV